MKARPIIISALFFIYFYNNSVFGETNAVPTVRVSAKRLRRLQTDSAGDSTYISTKQIERSQAVSVAELLAKEANIFFRSSTGKNTDGQVAMRGFGENSGLRVLIEVDGHKLNRPDMGQTDWNQIPIGDIQSIEVIRGGQNVLHGNHALAGIIKITTKKGGEPKLNLRSVYGSHDFQQHSVLASGASGNWYADLGVDYIKDPGWRDHSRSWSKTIHASIGRFTGENGTLTLRAAQGESYAQFPGPLTYEQFQSDPAKSSNLGDEFAESQNGHYTLLWESHHEWGQALINAGYSFRDIDGSISGIYSHNNQDGFSAAPQIKIGSGIDHIILGWDLFYDQVDYENYTSPSETKLNAWAELERITTGPYAFLQKELLKDLTLSGGVRYEQASTKNRYVKYDYTPAQPPTIPHPIFGFPIPNPNYDPTDTIQSVNAAESFQGTISKEGWGAEVTATWTPYEDFVTWVGYDRVYRYPSLDETASYQGFPLSDPLNEALSSEQGNGFEAGTKYDNGTFRASLTAFYLKMDNEIVYDSLRRLNTNTGKTRRKGIELETGVTLENGGFSARCELVEAEFADGPNKGNTVPMVPKARGNIAIWLQPVKQVRLTGRYSHVSPQFQGNDDANNQQRIDGYGLFGAQLDIIPSNWITLFIKVDNLFDKTYASSAYSGVWYPGAGRTVQAGVTMEF